MGRIPVVSIAKSLLIAGRQWSAEEPLGHCELQGQNLSVASLNMEVSRIEALPAMDVLTNLWLAD